jgi:REP element-mobilizing transposase RayT
MKSSSDEGVLTLSRDLTSTGLEYIIAYKTVGNTPFFKSETVRKSLMQLLDERAINAQVRIVDAKVFSYGLSFRVIAPTKLDINRFVTFTAQYLINQLNNQYPDLSLKATASNGSVPRLSRLWHRPYYVMTVTPTKFKSVSDYLV